MSKEKLKVELRRFEMHQNVDMLKPMIKGTIRITSRSTHFVEIDFCGEVDAKRVHDPSFSCILTKLDRGILGLESCKKKVKKRG